MPRNAQKQREREGELGIYPAHLQRAMVGYPQKKPMFDGKMDESDDQHPNHNSKGGGFVTQS